MSEGFRSGLRDGGVKLVIPTGLEGNLGYIDRTRVNEAAVFLSGPLQVHRIGPHLLGTPVVAHVESEPTIRTGKAPRGLDRDVEPKRV